jgi:hypothetical protein
MNWNIHVDGAVSRGEMSEFVDVMTFEEYIHYSIYSWRYNFTDFVSPKEKLVEK